MTVIIARANAWRRCWIAPLIFLIACTLQIGATAAARHEASRIQASTVGDRSFDPRTTFERLPKLRPLTQALGASSASSALDNRDYDHYLGEQHGERVLFDSPGPGTVQRFWHTGNDEFDYRFYFDGETTPRFIANGVSFWGAASLPFVAPLMLNPSQSSGGAVSYYPIAFAKSLRITAQPIAGSKSSLDYYDIGYERYDDDRSVVSFDGLADVADLGRVWQDVGLPLMAADADDRTQTNVQTIGAGEAVELAALDGPSEIVGIEFFVPALAQAIVRDDGRATFDGSRFHVAIDPANRGVRIVRRLDFHIADQTAEVFIDGVDVGTWTTPGGDPNDAWRDDGFWLPPDSTRGKDAIDIQLDVAAAGLEWNE
ncbi:MAG TPA: hypothetical protein VHZ95_12410, partial [Polyangiales bacterium]|nr:hypothetical protein [Polyangiales bacterium]